jgi:hypothetical protein
VIVDDVLYFDEPFFQDGVLARAWTRSTTQGVCRVGGGNADHRSYDAPFRDSGQTGFYPVLGETRRHDFDPGPGVDVFQKLTLPPVASTVVPAVGRAVRVRVDGEPAVGARSDYDLFVYNTETPAPRNFATWSRAPTRSTSDRDAFEARRVANPGATPLDVYVAIERFMLPAGFDGPDVDRMKLIDFGALPSASGRRAAGTSFGHANARGAIAVGAAAWFETPRFGVSPPRVETYSSAGGVPILFDGAACACPHRVVRETPTSWRPTASTRPSTNAPGDIPEDDDDFPNFFGTSARRRTSRASRRC